MLVVPERMKEAVEKVEQWALDNGIADRFHKAFTRMHLYGCSWTDPERARVTLYAQDFAPKSFLYSIEFRKEDGSYKHFLSGGLIFYGECNERGNLIRKDEHTGWGMHS